MVFKICKFTHWAWSYLGQEYNTGTYQ